MDGKVKEKGDDEENEAEERREKGEQGKKIELPQDTYRIIALFGGVQCAQHKPNIL